ncbi:hypothetical protein ABW21_db0203765 [Orbilia brochopaga]|nr:hypothetical protein ABW21_db0203765 [Drechslerella brochopaga]
MSVSTFDPEKAENLEDVSFDPLYNEKYDQLHLYPLPRTVYIPYLTNIATRAAVMHMQTHWGLLEHRRGSELTLTKFDDEIHEHFKETFPELDVSQKLDEDAMKSKEGKEKWRNFINQYDGKVLHAPTRTDAASRTGV